MSSGPRVALFCLHLFIAGSQSLKQKRGILQSLKARIRKQFNVSVAETGMHEKWQVAEISLSAVAPDASRFEATLNSLIEFIEKNYSDVEITYKDIDYL